VSGALAARLRHAAGFTVAEMLVALAVIGITIPALAIFVSTSYIHSSRTIGQSALQAEGRAAVDTLVADLRQAYYGDAVTSPIVSMSTTALTFYTPDRSQPFRLRKVAYQLSSGNLQRAFVTSTDTDGAPWQGLATLGPWRTQLKNVTSTAIFSYQDIDGVAITDMTQVAKVKRVTISLRARPNASTATSSFQSSVTLRVDR
jgi:prepilin-type N-terminal cleavage/methylation domain-containing protein